ncbi:ATP-binding cassette domain-containing protein [Gemmobacter lanyuensis]
MTKSQTSIEIRNLYKIFGAHPEAHVEAVRRGMSKEELGARHSHILGLNDINISMPAGKIQVIMGLSGSGKSTLIRHINRLIEPTWGEIVIGGQNVLEMSETELRDFRRTGTAMVFQKFALLPHRTVIDNVTFGLEVRGRCRRRPRHRPPLDRTGRPERVREPLSERAFGGMQQRVGLARALSNDTSILLMDEAYSALDPLIRTDMQTMLLDLQKELGKTIVFITHDLDEALRLGDQIVILRDGSIVQQGNSQDILLNPADDYIQRFIKDVNRGRYIRVASVIEPASESALPQVPAEMMLEDAVKVLSDAAASAANVIDAAGRIIGAVTLRTIMSVL